MKAASGLKVGSFKARTGIRKQTALIVPYLLVDRPEEVDLICQTLQLGLQLDLIHVGLIDILQPTQVFVRMSYRKELKWSSWEKKLQLEDKLSIISDTDLLDEDKVVLTLCAFVDFIFIPERKKKKFTVKNRLISL